MKEQELSYLIDELRYRFNYYRFSEQYVIDLAVNQFQILLTITAVIQVCRILLQNFNETYSLRENVQCAVEDFLQTSK